MQSQPDTTVLRDVEIRVRALAEVRRLRPMVASALEQLRRAKLRAAEAPLGSTEEHQSLQEAAAVSLQLSDLQAALHRADQDAQKTHYLVSLLTD